MEIHSSRQSLSYTSHGLPSHSCNDRSRSSLSSGRSSMAAVSSSSSSSHGPPQGGTCCLSPSFYRKKLQLLQTIKGLQSLVGEIFFQKASQSSLRFTCPCKEVRRKKRREEEENKQVDGGRAEVSSETRHKRKEDEGSEERRDKEENDSGSTTSSSCCRYAVFTFPGDWPLEISSREDGEEDTEDKEEKGSEGDQQLHLSTSERSPFKQTPARGKERNGSEEVDRAMQERRSHDATEEEREKDDYDTGRKKREDSAVRDSSIETHCSTSSSNTTRKNTRMAGPLTGDVLISKLLETVILPLLRKMIASLPSTVKSCLLKGSTETKRKGQDEGKTKDREVSVEGEEEAKHQEQRRQRQIFFLLQVAEIRCLLRVLSGLLTGRIDRVAPRGLSVISIRRIAEAACLLLSLPVHLLLVSSSISRHSSGGVHGENNRQEEKKKGKHSSHYSSFEDVWNDRRLSYHLTAASIGCNVSKPSQTPASSSVSFLSSPTSCEQREILASLVLHIREDWSRAIIDCMRVLRNYLQILSEQNNAGSCGDEGGGRRLQERRWRGLVTFEVEAADVLAYLARGEQSLPRCREEIETESCPLFSRTWESLLSLVDRKSSSASSTTQRGSHLLPRRLYMSQAYIHPAIISLHETLLFQIFQDGQLLLPPVKDGELFSQDVESHFVACLLPREVNLDASKHFSQVIQDDGRGLVHTIAHSGVSRSSWWSREGVCESAGTLFPLREPTHVLQDFEDAHISLTRAVSGLLGTVSTKRGSSGFNEARMHLYGLAIEGALRCVGNVRAMEERRRRRRVELPQGVKRKRCVSSSSDAAAERQVSEESTSWSSSMTMNFPSSMRSEEAFNFNVKRPCRGPYHTARQSGEEEADYGSEEEVSSFDRSNGIHRSTESVRIPALDAEKQLREDCNEFATRDWNEDLSEKIEAVELRLLDYWLQEIVRLDAMLKRVAVGEGRARSSTGSFREYRRRLRILVQEMHDLVFLPAAAFPSSACKTSPRTAAGNHVGEATSELLNYDNGGDVVLFDSGQHDIHGSCSRRLNPFYLVPHHRVPFLTRLTELLRVWLLPKVEGREGSLQGCYYGEEENEEEQGLIEWLLERWTSARCSLDRVAGDLSGGMSNTKTRCFSDVSVPRWTVPPETVAALKWLLPVVKDAFLRAEVLLGLPFLLFGIDKSEGPGNYENSPLTESDRETGQDAGCASRQTSREAVVAPACSDSELMSRGGDLSPIVTPFYLLGAIRCEGSFLEDSKELFRMCYDISSESEREGLLYLLLRRLDVVSSWARVEWQSSVCSPGFPAWGALSSFHPALVSFACHFFLSSFSSPRSGFLSGEEVGHGVSGSKERQEDIPLITHTSPRECVAERHVMKGSELRQCEGEEDARALDTPTILKQKIAPILCTLLGKKEKQTDQIDGTDDVGIRRASSLSPSTLATLVDVFYRVAAERCSFTCVGSPPSCGAPVRAPDDGLSAEETGSDGYPRPDNGSEGYASHCLWLSNFFREDLMFYLARLCTSTSPCDETEARDHEEGSPSLFDLGGHGEGLCRALVPQIVCAENQSMGCFLGSGEAGDNVTSSRGKDVLTSIYWNRIRILLRAVALDPTRSAEERLDFILWKVFPATLLRDRNPPKHEDHGDAHQTCVTTFTGATSSRGSCFRCRLSSLLQFCVLSWAAWLVSLVYNRIINVKPERKQSFANALSVFLSFVCTCPDVSRSSLRTAVCQLFPFVFLAISPPSSLPAHFLRQYPGVGPTPREKGSCSQGPRMTAADSLSRVSSSAQESQEESKTQQVDSSSPTQLSRLFRKAFDEILSCFPTAGEGDGEDARPPQEPWPPPFTYGCWLGLLRDCRASPVFSAAGRKSARSGGFRSSTCPRGSRLLARGKPGNAARNEATDGASDSFVEPDTSGGPSFESTSALLLCPFCGDMFDKHHSLGRFMPSSQSRAATFASPSSSSLSDQVEDPPPSSVFLPKSVAAPHIVISPATSSVLETDHSSSLSWNSGIASSVSFQPELASSPYLTRLSAASHIGPRRAREPSIECDSSSGDALSWRHQQQGTEERCCSKCGMSVVLLREHPLASLKHHMSSHLSFVSAPDGRIKGHDFSTLHGNSSVLVRLLRLLRAAVTCILSLSKTNPLYCSMASILSHVEPLGTEPTNDPCGQRETSYELMRRRLSFIPGAPVCFCERTNPETIFNCFLDQAAMLRSLCIIRARARGGGDAGDIGSEKWKAINLANQEAISVAVLTVVVTCLTVADCSVGMVPDDLLGALSAGKGLNSGRSEEYVTGKALHTPAGKERGQTDKVSYIHVQGTAGGETPEMVIEVEKSELSKTRDQWWKHEHTRDRIYTSVLSSCASVLLSLIRSCICKRFFSALPSILPSPDVSTEPLPPRHFLPPDSQPSPNQITERPGQADVSSFSEVSPTEHSTEVKERVKSFKGLTCFQEDLIQCSSWPWLLPAEGTRCAVGGERTGALARKILLTLVISSDSLLQALLISAVLTGLQECQGGSRMKGTDAPSPPEPPRFVVAGEVFLNHLLEPASTMRSLIARARLAVLFGAPLLLLCDSMTVASGFRSTTFSTRQGNDQQGANQKQRGIECPQKTGAVILSGTTNRPAGGATRRERGGRESERVNKARCETGCFLRGDSTALCGGDRIGIACCSGVFARLKQAYEESNDFRRSGLLSVESPIDLPGIMKTLVTMVVAANEDELLLCEVLKSQSACRRVLDPWTGPGNLTPHQIVGNASSHVPLPSAQYLHIRNACCCGKPSPSFQLFGQLLQTGERDISQEHAVHSGSSRDPGDRQSLSPSSVNTCRVSDGPDLAITALRTYRRETLAIYPSSGVFLPSCQGGPFPSPLWYLDSSSLPSGCPSASAALYLKDALAAVYAGATAACTSERVCESFSAVSEANTSAAGGCGPQENTSASTLEAGSRAVSVAMRYFEYVSGSVGSRTAPASLIQACCGDGACCLDAVFSLFFCPAISSSTAKWHADDKRTYSFRDSPSTERMYSSTPSVPMKRLSAPWCRSILMLFVGPSTYTLVLQGRRRRSNLVTGSPVLYCDERGVVALRSGGKTSRLLSSLSAASEHAEQELCAAALLPGLLWHADLDVRRLSESVGLFKLRPQWDGLLARLLLSIPDMCTGGRAGVGVAGLTRFLVLATQQSPTWGRQRPGTDYRGGACGLVEGKRLQTRLLPPSGNGASTAPSEGTALTRAVNDVRKEPKVTGEQSDAGTAALDRLCLLAVVRCLWSAANADTWFRDEGKTSMFARDTSPVVIESGRTDTKDGSTPCTGHPRRDLDADWQAEEARAWLRSRLALLYCARLQAEGRTAVPPEDTQRGTLPSKSAIGQRPSKPHVVSRNLADTPLASDVMDVDEVADGGEAKNEIANTGFSNHSGSREAVELHHHHQASLLNQINSEGLGDKFLEDFLTPHRLEIEELLLHCIFPPSLPVPPATPQYLISYLHLFLSVASVPVLIVSLLIHKESHLSPSGRKTLWETLTSFLDKSRGLRMLFLTISCSHRRLLDTHAARLVDSLNSCFQATQKTLHQRPWLLERLGQPILKSSLCVTTPGPLQVYFAALRLLILSFSAPTLLSYAPSFLNTLGEFQRSSPEVVRGNHFFSFALSETNRDGSVKDSGSCARNADCCGGAAAEAAELIALLIARGFEAIEANEVPPCFFYATLACTPVFPPLPSQQSFSGLPGITDTDSGSGGSEISVDSEKEQWPSSQYLNEDQRSRFDVTSPPSLLPLFSLLLSFIYHPSVSTPGPSSPSPPVTAAGRRTDDMTNMSHRTLPSKSENAAGPQPDLRLHDEQQRQYIWEQREFVSAQMRWPLEVTVIRFAAVAAFLNDVYPYLTRLAAAETLQKLLRVYGTPLVRLLYQARSVEEDGGGTRAASLGEHDTQEALQRADGRRTSLDLMARVTETCQAVVAEFCDDYSRQPKALPVRCASLLGFLIPILSPRSSEVGYNNLQLSSRGGLVRGSQPTGAPTSSAAADALGVNIVSSGERSTRRLSYSSPMAEGAGQQPRKAEQGSKAGVRDGATCKLTDCWWRISDDGKLCCELLERVLICNLHLPVAARSTQEVLKVLGFHIHSPKGRLAQMFPFLAESFFGNRGVSKPSLGSELPSVFESPPSSRSAWNTTSDGSLLSSQAGGVRAAELVSFQIRKGSTSSPFCLAPPGGGASPSLSHLEPSPWHTFVWKKVLPSQVRTALLPYCFTSYERVSALKTANSLSGRPGRALPLSFKRSADSKSPQPKRSDTGGTAPSRTLGLTDELNLPTGGRACKRAVALRALIMWMLRRLHQQQAIMLSQQGQQQTARKCQQSKLRRNIPERVDEKSLQQSRGPSGGGSTSSSKQQEVTVISSSSSSEEEKERPRPQPARLTPTPRGALRLAVFKACDVVLLQLPKVLSFLLPHMTDSILCTAADPEGAARELASRITTLLVASAVGSRKERGCAAEAAELRLVHDSPQAGTDAHADNGLATETSDSHSTCQALFGLLQKLHDWHSWIRGESLPSLSARIKSTNQEVKSLQNETESVPGEQGAKAPNRSGENAGATNTPGQQSRRRARLDIALRRLERYKAQEHRQKALAHALQTLLRGVDPLLLARAAAGCGAYARTSLGIVGLPACVFAFCRSPRGSNTKAVLAPPASSEQPKTGEDLFRSSFRLLVEILRGLDAGDALTGLLEVRRLLSTRGGSIPLPGVTSTSLTGGETALKDSKGLHAPCVPEGRLKDPQAGQDASMDVDMDAGADSGGDETEDDADFAHSFLDEERVLREIDTVDMRAIENEFGRHWTEAAALYLQGAVKESSVAGASRDLLRKSDCDKARANGNILSPAGRWAGWFRCISRAGPSAVSGIWPSAAALCVSLSSPNALARDSDQRDRGGHDQESKTASHDTPGIIDDTESPQLSGTRRAILPGGLVAAATSAYWSLGKWDQLRDLVHTVVDRSVSASPKNTLQYTTSSQYHSTTNHTSAYSQDTVDDGIHAQDTVESWMALQHARLLLAARQKVNELCFLSDGSTATTLCKPGVLPYRSALHVPVLRGMDGAFSEVAFQAYEQTVRGVVRPLGAALRESRDRAMPLLTRLHILSDFSLISLSDGSPLSCLSYTRRTPLPGSLGLPEGLRDCVDPVWQGDYASDSYLDGSNVAGSSRTYSEISSRRHLQCCGSSGTGSCWMLTSDVGRQLALSSLLLQRASLRCAGERNGDTGEGTASDAFQFVLGAAKVALESTNHTIAAAALGVTMRFEQRRHEQLLNVPGAVQFGDYTEVISQAKESWRRIRNETMRRGADTGIVLVQTREEKKAVARLVHCMRIENALQLLDQGQVSEGLQALSLLASFSTPFSLSATVPSAMVLYIQQATKRLLLPAEGAIACFEQAVRQQQESSGVYYQYALFIDSLISTRLEEEKSRPPSLFSHIGQQGYATSTSSSGGGNRQPQSAGAASPSRLAVVPGRTDRAEAEREEAARQQHHSTHRVSALLFTFCTPNTFITPHTRLDLRTCEMYAERLTRVVMREEGARVPPQYWFEVVEQIACRCQHPLLGREVCGALLARLMSRYPWRTLWHVVSLGNTVVRDRSRREALTRTLETIVAQAADMQKRASPSTPPCQRVIDIYRVAARFAKEMHKVAMDEEIRREDALNASNRYPELYAMFSPELSPGSQVASVAVPTQANLQVGPADASGDTSSLVTIVSVSTQVQVFPSKQRPKKMTVLGSDGRTYSFLVKNERHGDLRKDSRTMGLAENVNKLLAHDPVCRAKNLRLKTFSVTVLSEVTGMIEWVEGNTTLRKCVWALYHELIPDFPSITAEVVKAFQRAQSKRDHAEAYRVFTQVALNKIPPVMQRLFFKWFSDNPSKWYRSRRNYARTLALWSFFGFIIGLGDRHGENILLDSSDGTVMHVDFDCLLEKGRTLPVPEVVPFRLTQNLVSCLGMTGVEGVFKVAAVSTMSVMRQNRDSLISILMNFVHDPLIEWRQATARHAQVQQQQQRKQGQSLLGPEASDGWEKLAYECLVEIDYKLSGGVGVTARSLPPHIPLAILGSNTQPGTDSGGSHASGKTKGGSFDGRLTGAALGEEGNVVRGGEGQLSSPSNSLPVQDQVHAVVQSAMCLHNLSRMYIGWVPWL
ncbi:fatc domain-containing protein [Cystoisospora suis]|uniref:Fatc domain-containing protein n=1 Tax=Cystoisospora suis TaxID=483139 RepID=A0A2C6KZ40_9APIC|nr:fatc domain-containing protein [Cystoisospora suis]